MVQTPPNEPRPPGEFYRSPFDALKVSLAHAVQHGLPGSEVLSLVRAVAQVAAAEAQHRVAQLRAERDWWYRNARFLEAERDEARRQVKRLGDELGALSAAASAPALQRLRAERDAALQGAEYDRTAADAAIRAAQAARRDAAEARGLLASTQAHLKDDQAHLRAMLWGPGGSPPVKTTAIEERMTWHEDAREAERAVRARVEAARTTWKSDEGVTR